MISIVQMPDDLTSAAVYFAPVGTATHPDCADPQPAQRTVHLEGADPLNLDVITVVDDFACAACGRTGKTEVHEPSLAVALGPEPEGSPITAPELADALLASLIDHASCRRTRSSRRGAAELGREKHARRPQDLVRLLQLDDLLLQPLDLRLRLTRDPRLPALVHVEALLPQSKRLRVDAELRGDVLDRSVIGLVIGASLAQHPQRTVTKLVRIWSWHNSILQKERTERNSGRINQPPMILLVALKSRFAPTVFDVGGIPLPGARAKWLTIPLPTGRLNRPAARLTVCTPAGCRSCVCVESLQPLADCRRRSNLTH
jgi:hypothetical protein